VFVVVKVTNSASRIWNLESGEAKMEPIKGREAK